MGAGEWEATQLSGAAPDAARRTGSERGAIDLQGYAVTGNRVLDPGERAKRLEDRADAGARV